MLTPAQWQHVHATVSSSGGLRQAFSTLSSPFLQRAERDQLSIHTELAAAFQEYSRLKIEKSVLDFHDLISLSLKLLAHESVASKVASRFQHILVDEFQVIVRIHTPAHRHNTLAHMHTYP